MPPGIKKKPPNGDILSINSLFVLQGCPRLVGRAAEERRWCVAALSHEWLKGTGETESSAFAAARRGSAVSQASAHPGWKTRTSVRTAGPSLPPVLIQQ